MLYPTELRAQAMIHNDFKRRKNGNGRRERSLCGARCRQTGPGMAEKALRKSVIRHVPSGIYYARLRVKGKLIRLAGFGRRVCRWTGFAGETAAGIFLKMISRVDFIL
jgi:hypothetical protein